MDTVNILTTYLSAPAGLPLPTHVEAALSRAQTLGALADKVTVELAAGADPQNVWRLGLIDAVGLINAVGLIDAVGQAQLAATA